MTAVIVDQQIIGILYTTMTIYYIYDFYYFISGFCNTLANCFAEAGTITCLLLLPFLSL